MCNPAFVLGLQAVGGLTAADGAQKQGKAQQAYYDYLAGQNERQAKDVLAAGEKQMTFIQDDAARETKALRASQRQFEGSQKVALAANGIPLSSVSVEDLAHDTFKREELDAEALRYNADTKSYEARMQARSSAVALRDQAGAYRFAGKNAKYAGDINATTSLIGTATSMASTWADYSKTSKGATGSSYATVSGRRVSVAPPNYYKGR